MIDYEHVDLEIRNSSFKACVIVAVFVRARIFQGAKMDCAVREKIC